ncbi:class II aldolase/adducin family protein [Aestuariirhabdus sp. LZHN29]|uniref:class II aldolase/adducin family protein n=1 Tax=Aestuariirhabdus sp. LZHN29 TaxID=3417462 RepID=UPI003CEB40A9
MEREGVVKYQCHHRERPLPAGLNLDPLNHWRRQMLQRGMIGQSDSRYQGLGFGNISQRLPPEAMAHRPDEFIISGTQTGHLAQLDATSVARVEHADPLTNQLWSSGDCPPSSEALSHAVIYQQRRGCGAVIHVHCPLIWQRALELELPCTGSGIAYGTPAMANAIAQLLLRDEGIIAMLGHEDGIISYAPSLDTAAQHLIALQAKASTLADGCH